MRTKNIIIWSLTINCLMAVFWTGYYFVVGSVPVVTAIQVPPSWVIDLPFGVSRWFDVALAGPIWSISLWLLLPKTADLNIRSFLAIPQKMVSVLVSGLIIGLVIWPAVGLFWGLTIGMVFVMLNKLYYGFLFALLFGLFYGAFYGLVAWLAVGTATTVIYIITILTVGGLVTLIQKVASKKFKRAL